MTAAVCACFANAVTAGQAQSADEQQIRVLIAAEETGKRPYLVRCYGCGRKETGNGRKRPFHTRARHEPARSQVDIRSRCVRQDESVFETTSVRTTGRRFCSFKLAKTWEADHVDRRWARVVIDEHRAQVIIVRFCEPAESLIVLAKVD